MGHLTFPSLSQLASDTSKYFFPIFPFLIPSSFHHPKPYLWQLARVAAHEKGTTNPNKTASWRRKRRSIIATSAAIKAFVCRRCGGGFLQEMPPDPTPPPRDPLPVAQSGLRDTTTSSPVSAATLSSFRTHGVPATSVTGMTSAAPQNAQRQTSVQQQQQQNQGPSNRIVFGTDTTGGNPYALLPQQQPGSPGGPHVVRSQVTVTAVPISGSGVPLGPPVRFAMNQPAAQQPPQGYIYSPYGMIAAPQNPYAVMQPPMAVGPARSPSPYTTFFQAPANPYVAAMQQQQVGGGVQQQQPQYQPHFHFQQNPNAPQQQVAFGMPHGQFLHPMQTLMGMAGNENLLNTIAANMDDLLTQVLNQLGAQGGPPPMTQEDVDRIPSTPATKEMIAESKVCAICLDSFVLGVPFKEMPCTHQFHGSCIDRWLLMHGNCPICRTHFGGAGVEDDGAGQDFDVTVHLQNMPEHHHHHHHHPVGPNHHPVGPNDRPVGPNPRFQFQQQQQQPHIQQMFYRPVGGAGPSRAPQMGNIQPRTGASPRNFVFSPGPYAGSAGQQRPVFGPQIPQQHPMMYQQQSRMPAATSPTPVSSMAGPGWSGQMFSVPSNAPGQNVVVLDAWIGGPPAAPGQAVAPSQPQRAPRSSAASQTASTRTQTPQNFGYRGGRPAAPQASQPGMRNPIADVMSGILQQFSQPPGQQLPRTASTAPVVPPGDGGAAAAAGTSSSSAAAAIGSSSGAGTGTVHPQQPDLQDDLGFD
ncbi:putative E3 ubiquitin-protein ligase RNF126 [Hypsibius exemplaris]|uniref:E3 ubiquitin-protein ligase RNF126 n=1 Tax=Hypsibius exemplaris TaxID=2072580 RepID=A0A1W0X4J0_HYPEX|nr:putative E3 ubiquitin-protein ligase RNF126 [Hypsibius exemplaris]